MLSRGKGKGRAMESSPLGPPEIGREVDLSSEVPGPRAYQELARERDELEIDVPEVARATVRIKGTLQPLVEYMGVGATAAGFGAGTALLCVQLHLPDPVTVTATALVTLIFVGGGLTWLVFRQKATTPQ
jgi:hypothetical protein